MCSTHGDKLFSKKKSLDVLETLKLTDKFPQRLSLRDSIAISQETLGINITDQLAALPYLILQKIMMCDRRCLSFLYQPECSSDVTIHPVDCLLAVIHCCDDILRHNLFYKLSLCRLAVPLLLPNPLDDSVTFLLWALRSLLKCHAHNVVETRLVHYKGPIVTFLRIGELQASKSQILNEVLGSQKHFFSWDSKKAVSERKLVDGLVEMHCYHPTCKDEDFYTDNIIFLNLRGDAQLHPKQVEFLRNISVFSVVLIGQDNINTDTIELLKKVLGPSEGVVLLFDEGKPAKPKSSIDELFHHNFPQDKCSIIHLKSKETTAVDSIQQALVHKLKFIKPDNFKSLSSCCQIAYKAGINIDEDNEHCKAGRKMANTVMEQVNSVCYADVKQKLLPLQGLTLWQLWARHDREQYCHLDRKNETISEYNLHKKREKADIRKSQVETHLSPLMDCFIKCIMNKDIPSRSFFLQWLKLFLDDAKTKGRCDSEHHANTKLCLDHFFREIGQIYESRMSTGVENVPDTLKDEAKCFAQAVAEIMHEGHALEMMDGEASHVPVKWVLAVIEKLRMMCGKDVQKRNGGKVFVLSVLGFKDKGKSTLLNTMFGLHFNVRAGQERHCTRGAYMQLVPLTLPLRNAIECDFLLIVDTEGLSVPNQRERCVLKHENKLATFFVGLADVTIFHLPIEAPYDLDDVIQIVVHGLIRMKVDKINPGCVFMFQHFLENKKNVVFGSEALQDELNAIIQMAAKTEKCEGQYKLFSHVIGFDDEKDTFYVPNFVENSSMIVNPDYVESANRFKVSLIELIKRKQSHLCSLQTVKLRIKNIWYSILQENFIFTFKNTFEIFDYCKFEYQSCQWSWKMHCEMLEWKSGINEKSSMCNGSKDSIMKVAGDCSLKVIEVIKRLSDNKQSLETLPQHKQDFLKWFDDETEKEANKYYEELAKKIGLLDMKFEEVLDLCEQENTLLSIRKMIEETGQNYNPAVIESKFEAIWIKWMENYLNFIPHNMVEYPSDRELEVAITEILKQILPTSYYLVIKKLSDAPLNKRSSSLQLTINKNCHLHLLVEHRIDENDLQVAQSLTANYLQNASCYFKAFQFDSRPFSLYSIHGILNQFMQAVNEFASKKFVFTSEYKVDLALVLCAYAYDVSEKAIKVNIEEDRKVFQKLNQLKTDCLDKVKNVYRGMISATHAVNHSCKLLVGSLEETLTAALMNSVTINDIVSKVDPKLPIWKYLGEMESFEQYKAYLYNDVENILLIICIYEYVQNEIELKAKKVLDIIIQQLNDVAVNISRDTTISTWLDAYCTKVQQLYSFSIDRLDTSGVDYCVNEEFLDNFSNKIDEMRLTLESKLSWIKLELSKQLKTHPLVSGGCKARCPFCQEKCALPANHAPSLHQVLYHRPVIVCDQRVIHHASSCYKEFLTCPGIINIEENNAKFICSQTKWQPQQYERYHEVFKHWYIEPKTEDLPAFWKWFIFKFRSEIAQSLGITLEVPDDWNTITFENAVASLKSDASMYHIT